MLAESSRHQPTPPERVDLNRLHTDFSSHLPAEAAFGGSVSPCGAVCRKPSGTSLNGYER